MAAVETTNRFNSEILKEKIIGPKYFPIRMCSSHAANTLDTFVSNNNLFEQSYGGAYFLQKRKAMMEIKIQMPTYVHNEK